MNKPFVRMPLPFAESKSGTFRVSELPEQCDVGTMLALLDDLDADGFDPVQIVEGGQVAMLLSRRKPTA